MKVSIIPAGGELPLYKTSANAHLFPKWVEKISPISKTRPDQSHTVDELQKRFASGLPMSGVKTPFYIPENHPFSGVKWESMDLAEREQMMKDAVETYKAAVAEVQRLQREKDEKAYNEKLEKQIRYKLNNEMRQAGLEFNSPNSDNVAPADNILENPPGGKKIKNK